MTGGVLSTSEEANTMGRTIMDLLRGGRWARGGLLAATFAMGASLVVTSPLSYRSVVHASGLVSRSQGEALLRSTFFLVRPGQDPPERSTLAALLEEQAAAGLRYVAIFDPQARVIAGPPPPPPGRTGRGATGASEPPRRPRLTIAIEFEPLVARQLSAQAARALGFGVVAAFGLMAVALLFSRQLLRQEAAERRFENQRRLAVLGEMSSVIAHELRNPLASLKGHAQLLAERLPADGRERKKAERIVLEAQRLETLSGDLLDFSRSGPIDRKAADPAALLRAAADSVDASRDLERIFEPFYTTRPTGTGLGLAVAQRIVQMHGGTLTATNDPGGRASFRMAIPRA